MNFDRYIVTLIFFIKTYKLLGLALTNRLVNLHNGKIWFESKLGDGSTFIFTIPKNN